MILAAAPARIAMIVREIYAKSILSESKISEYTVNPYFGCEHGCTYCYARFMKRFTGRNEPWGEFVDVKINAPTLLQREINRKKPGEVWISGVCDPYQPLERKYELTRSCLRILLKRNWPVCIQTKSPLVVRDMDLLRMGRNVEVILTITTGDEHVRKIFEPKAPSIGDRVEALRTLHSAGIKTCVMIAPLLPGAELLAKQVNGIVDSILIDRMNYNYADWVYRKHGLEYALKDEFFMQKKRELIKAFKEMGVNCQAVF